MCDELIGGEFANFVVIANPLLIIQNGDRFRFLYTGEPEEELADDLVYEGVIQNVEGSDHFEAIAGICGGDYDAEEIVRLRRIEISEEEAALMPSPSSSPMTTHRPRGSRFLNLQVGVRAGVDGAAQGAKVRAERHSPNYATMKATGG